MSTVFDSSVIIAACVEAHPKHIDALWWLQRAQKGDIEYLVSAHSLLEVYSVLTGAPFKPRISPITAKKLIEHNIVQSAKIISLSGKEYLDIIAKMESMSLKGGIVYDAIIAKYAQKMNATEIVTVNKHDFSRLIPDNSIKIVSL